MALGMIDLSMQWSEDNRSSWIQIMTTGNWDHPSLGKIKVTKQDLHQFKENFDKRIRGVNLFVDVSHNPDEGAVGEFKELDVRGEQLWAKVDWTEEGANLIKSGKFNYFSPEFMFSWKDPASGAVYKDVLLGGALTNRPFLKNMERVALSEDFDMFQVQFADDETYDPDDDGDDDATADPKKNPDWESDVRKGILPWSKLSKEQQDQLTKKGFTKDHADKANKRAKVMMSESNDGITNAHKSPPKGKPQDPNKYADPEHFKYPIDDAGHIQSAMGYYNVAGNQQKGGYDDAKWAEMGRKIVAAANKQFGPGHSLKNGKIITPSTAMDDGTGDDNTDPNDGTSSPHPDDDKTAGKFTEPGGGKVNGNQNPDGTVSFAEFQAAQQKIQMLETENRRAKLTEKVRGWMFDEKNRTGKIVPAQQDKVVEILMSMSDEQVTKFEEFVKELPAPVNFNEIGVGGQNSTGGDKSDAVVKLAEKKMREESITWKEAFIAASDELGVK